jgi:hypothetical protein
MNPMTCTTERGPAVLTVRREVFILRAPGTSMMESDLDQRLHNLRESLGRLKALLAWGRLKRCEANASSPWMFQMHDPTVEQLKDEYSFFLALLLNTYTLLDDHSSSLPEPIFKDAGQQLADMEWQVHLLQLDRRF